MHSILFLSGLWYLKKKNTHTHNYVNTNQNLPHSVVDVFISYLQHDFGPVMLIM